MKNHFLNPYHLLAGNRHHNQSDRPPRHWTAPSRRTRWLRSWADAVGIYNSRSIWLTADNKADRQPTTKCKGTEVDMESRPKSPPSRAAAGEYPHFRRLPQARGLETRHA